MVIFVSTSCGVLSVCIVLYVIHDLSHMDFSPRCSKTTQSNLSFHKNPLSFLYSPEKCRFEECETKKMVTKHLCCSSAGTEKPRDGGAEDLRSEEPLKQQSVWPHKVSLHGRSVPSAAARRLSRIDETPTRTVGFQLQETAAPINT